MPYEFTRTRFLTLMAEVQAVQAQLEDLVYALHKAQKKQSPQLVDYDAFSKLTWDLALKAQKQNTAIIAEIQRYLKENGYKTNE